MYCARCGRENPASEAFCPYCGAPLQAAAPGQSAYQAPPPPPSVGPGQALGGSPAAATPAQSAHQTLPPPSPKNSSVLLWLLVILGVIAISVAVILFLVFAGGGSEAGEVEKVARDLFRSIENKDAGLFLDLLEPSYREQLEDALGGDPEELLGEYFFSQFPDDIKVVIRKMDTDIDGDKAVVRVTDGTVTYTDEYGEKVTERASASDMDVLEMVKVKGEWYLSGSMMSDLGLGPEELKDLLRELKGGGDLSGGGEEPGGSAEELAEVEAVMLRYIRENSVPGLTFIIKTLMIKGDEAVGIATCITQGYENFPVIARKGPAGWYGSDMGTGIDVPTWLQEEMVEINRAMSEYMQKYQDAQAKGLSVGNIWAWGNEAAGQVIDANGELVGWVTATKGPSGWRATTYGYHEILPDWCLKILYSLSE